MLGTYLYNIINYIFWFDYKAKNGGKKSRLELSNCFVHGNQVPPTLKQCKFEKVLNFKLLQFNVLFFLQFENKAAKEFSNLNIT